MQKTRTKVGLLGAGYIVTSHAMALRAEPGVEPFAVCDSAPGRAERVAARFGVPNAYSSLDELVESPVDAVHVLLPPRAHVAAAERLLLAGKSVFLEKPMGLSSADCARLTELARERGLKLGVNHNFLFTPAYESVRRVIKDGDLGPIDLLTVNWLYPLGIVQLGPFNNWMLRSPENLLFELAPHAAAYALDLLGHPDELSCKAADPIDLPGHQRVYRRWTVLGSRGRSSFVINLSVNPGQPDRSLSARGYSAVARLDYERGVSWVERARTNSAIFDGLAQGRALSGSVRRQSRANFWKYLSASIRKAPGANVFQESVQRSIAAFYAAPGPELDPRLEGSFGVEVIRLLERAAECSGVVKPPAPRSAIGAASPKKPADTLVIGGTGFIGAHLVARLAREGRGVRVLTRNRATAELAFEGLPVEIVEGSHGDPAALDAVLPGMRTVYHLAKAVGEKWDDYLRGDVRPTETLARACLRHEVGRLVYTGTIDSYRSSESSAVINGETPLDPKIERRNNYARSKAACEAVLQRLHGEEGLPLVVLRPGIVIGRGSPPAHWGVGMFLSDALVRYWGDGDNPLPFVLVDDVAQALALAGQASGIDGRTFLLTDAPMLSAREYVGLVERFSGARIRQVRVTAVRYFLEELLKEAVKNAIRHPNRRIPYYGDWACRAHRSVYDSSATARDLGWRPVGDKAAMIEKGIKAAVEYYYR